MPLASEQNSMKYSVLAFAVVVVAVVVLLVSWPPRLAVGSSSETFTHPPVALRDEAGKTVNPQDADAKPYSPRKTCGGCHPYDTITKAYHFQMGAEVMSDDWGAKNRNRPWIQSPGQNGGQHHMSYMWLAKKVNRTEAEVGLSTYQYAQTCAVCHPGGSIFENDRDGRRYDTRQAAEPEIASSLDGDYHKAAWDRSGVLEADCLMCHKPDYDHKARTTQVSSANYRWAATAGAGVGDVEGSVIAGQTPTLKYKPSNDSSDRITIVPKRPTDRNCLLCHGEAETKKRGHVWDGRNEDVHSGAGMTCISCHPSGIDHQIAKGRSNSVFVNDELDSDEVSCVSCHTEGRMGASRPKHEGIPPNHLKTIACVTCHVRDSNVTAVHTVDTTTGKTVGTPTNPAAKKYGETASWQPAYFRLKDGKISTGNALLPAWWGNRVGNVIHPLTLAETGRAYEKVKDSIRDDNGDGKPEANTGAEIATMLRSVGQTMTGGRFDVARPVFVKGDKVYEVRNRSLKAEKHPQASPMRWTFSHNVSSAKRALGANGCTDCHGSSSTFFVSPVTTDPFGPDGKPRKQPMWRYLGLKDYVRNAGG